MVSAVLGLALLAVPLSALVGRVEWSTLWADVTSPEAVSALGDLSARPTLSIGVAEGRLSEMSLDAIIVSADESLYLAKRAGRDRVHGTPASEVLETA